MLAISRPHGEEGTNNFRARTKHRGKLPPIPHLYNRGFRHGRDNLRRRQLLLLLLTLNASLSPRDKPLHRHTPGGLSRKRNSGAPRQHRRPSLHRTVSHTRWSTASSITRSSLPRAGHPSLQAGRRRCPLRSRGGGGRGGRRPRRNAGPMRGRVQVCRLRHRPAVQRAVRGRRHVVRRLDELLRRQSEATLRQVVLDRGSTRLPRDTAAAAAVLKASVVSNSHRVHRG